MKYLCLISVWLISNTNCFHLKYTVTSDDKFVSNISSSETVIQDVLPYTKSEWDELIATKVNLSDLASLHQHVQWLMELSLASDSDIINTNTHPISPNYIPFRPLCINDIINKMLYLYSLRRPFRDGSYFYELFNRNTNDAIQKKIPFNEYKFAVEYLLLDRAHSRRSFKPGTMKFYAGDLSVPRVVYRVNDTFRFNQFISAFENELFADGYLYSGGAIFKIQNPTVLPMSFTSSLLGREEYLISPFEEFTITYTGKDSDLTEVRLSAPCD